MKKLIHNHFFALLAWVVILVISLVALPNVNQLTREHSQITLPNSTQSQIAQTIEQQHWGHHVNNTYQVVAVFSNGNQKMSAADRQNVQETVDRLRKHQDEYGIKAVMGPNDNAATRKQLISKDQTTQLVQLNISKKHGTLQKINRQLSTAVKTTGLKTYITGADILNDDFSGAVQQGIKKTEVISIIFIFIVLLIVFRSPITPLISLLMVGVSFMTSFSIVTNLVDKFNFPFSNFTQVFMIIVLFGIGTDYDILLYNQFKENLGKGMEKWAATKDAQEKAGRTILYSGSSLLIGFTSLGLARFSVYQSAVGVAIGVAVLLIVLLTLNPFFMAVLGKKMFWPDKRFTGESSSKIWQRMANNSVHHPVITLILVFAILLPIGLVNRNQLNYNDADEISNSTPSKKGFNVVEDHFSKGTAEPVTVYIKSNHRLDNEKNLLLIDRLTNQLKDSADGDYLSGLQAGGDYLSGLQKSAAADSFYIPNNQLKNAEFQQSVNNYLSADKKTAKLMVILNSNPSASRATTAVNGLTKISKYSLKGTALGHATVVVGGQSSKINDTKTVAGGDFMRTAIIMIVGIGLALVYVTRSLLQPVYVLGTLVTAYMASLSITHLLTRLILGRPMLTWNTPFFSFIMLIALGVDYSIFLIMRYRNTDNQHHLPTERIVMAASAIGTVVISAAVILSGTFASLIPSGIPTLIEVAMAVIIGLIILVIIIPLVVPSTIHLTYPMRSAMRDNQAKRKGAEQN